MNYLILGGTGTLGRATIKALLMRPKTEKILCVSRDELKQFELGKEIADDRLSFALGDVRDRSSIQPYFDGVDVCFHFAALKRIPEMEANPHESLKTNVLGTINAAECAIEAKVPYFVFSSTDKACLPVNTYGACKFLSEQILFNYNLRQKTVFSVYRWGNIINSRGSVIPSFAEAIKLDRPVKLTSPLMTRFWLKIEDAVEFMLESYWTRKNEVKVPPLKAAHVLKVIDALGDLIGKTPQIERIPIRPGEKLHEALTPSLNSENAEQFSHDELKTLLQGAI